VLEVIVPETAKIKPFGEDREGGEHTALISVITLLFTNSVALLLSRSFKHELSQPSTGLTVKGQWLCNKDKHHHVRDMLLHICFNQEITCYNTMCAVTPHKVKWDCIEVEFLSIFTKLNLEYFPKAYERKYYRKNPLINTKSHDQ